MTKLAPPAHHVIPIDLGLGTTYAMIPYAAPARAKSSAKRKRGKKAAEIPAQVGRRGKPYTSADANTLYGESRPFRQLANRTAVLLDGGVPLGREDASDPKGQALAEAAAEASTKMAELLAPTAAPERRYYVHPGLILAWAHAIARDGDPAIYKELPSPEVLAALQRAFRVPARGFARWNRFLRNVAVAASVEPHWFQAKVFAHVPPKAKALRGFPLRSITVRIPFGTVAHKGARDQTYFAPESSQLVTIDLTGEPARALVGELWLAVSDDGRGLFLVSTARGRITQRELVDLLNAGQATATTAGNLPLGDADLRGVTPTVPADLQTALRQAALATRVSRDAAVPVDVVAG